MAYRPVSPMPPLVCWCPVWCVTIACTSGGSAACSAGVRSPRDCMSMLMYVGIAMSVTQSAGATISSSMVIVALIHEGAVRHPPLPHPPTLSCASSTPCVPRRNGPAWRVAVARSAAIQSPGLSSMWANITPAGTTVSPCEPCL